MVSSDISGSIILLVVLLILSIYFSATETSITAAGKGKLLALSDEYPHRRKDFLWLVDNTAKAINVTLIGNNLVNIAASAVARFDCASESGKPIGICEPVKTTGLSRFCSMKVIIEAVYAIVSVPCRITIPS